LIEEKNPKLRHMSNVEAFQYQLKVTQDKITKAENKLQEARNLVSYLESWLELCKDNSKSYEVLIGWAEEIASSNKEQT
jgi:hypothetical protein